MIWSPCRDVLVGVAMSAGSRRRDQGETVMADQLDHQHHHLDAEGTDEAEDGTTEGMETDETMSETTE
jgi:hypothetical protein